MDSDRGSVWITAAQATLALAIFATVIECSTFLWRFASESPDWLAGVVGLYGVVYSCTILFGIPVAVLTAIVVGFKRGRPRKLGLISGLLVLAGFGLAILALVTSST